MSNRNRHGVCATDREFVEARRTIDSETGCWVWVHKVNPDGYARVKRRGKYIQVHRLSYETYVGEIPPGLVLDHTCRNRRCINPAHLEPVTNRENVLRGDGLTARYAARTHCVNGHEFTVENTRMSLRSGNSPPARVCRACVAARKRRAPTPTAEK